MNNANCKRCLCKQCKFNSDGKNQWCLQLKTTIEIAIKTCKPKVILKSVLEEQEKQRSR